jgi:ribosome modulation factor
MEAVEEHTSHEGPPELRAALEEGYDARGRGMSHRDNPYDKQEQPEKYEKWLSGLRAHRRDEIRRRIQLDAETGVVHGIEVRAPSTGDVCEVCAERDGTVYPIEEALMEPPIPHDDCDSDWCRCVYISITDRHHPYL